ncbi:CopD family protein [Bermanella sp. WJH001]|uniref:CopD family protein n=1 Tax=Bermanella sp. WJH001 TaxID=3048005 RepID=UPI0024BEEB0E|nr:CopD family protein [Bermanella sp. WJH001]MDJ1539308.1 CopD family protein [Bermanella sp. WJH001]
MAIAISLHILAACIWVGGMFFAYVCLRPVAADILEPPARLTLWRGVFERFFKWVGLAIVALIISGHFMIAMYGGMKVVGIHVHIMLLLGYIMFGIFGHVFFAPFKRLKAAVDNQDWPAGAAQLNTIRKMVGINLVIGLITIAVASAGRFI